MLVYIIRHGQSEGNRQQRNCGWSATPLSELGHRQAVERAGRIMKDVPLDRVYCSDLQRTRETAADALPGRELVLSPKIREISVGNLADYLFTENAERYGDAYWEACKAQDFSAYGGESQAEMKERVVSFIHDLEALEGLEHVAVVGHEGTVHQMMNYIVGNDILLEHLQVDNASVSVFAYENGTWRLVKFNLT